jgi:hypothetical protein
MTTYSAGANGLPLPSWFRWDNNCLEISDDAFTSKPYTITYSIEQSPSWEANRSAASQEIPRIYYGTRRFITVLTSARHLSLSPYTITVTNYVTSFVAICS